MALRRHGDGQLALVVGIFANYKWKWMISNYTWGSVHKKHFTESTWLFTCSQLCTWDEDFLIKKQEGVPGIHRTISNYLSLKSTPGSGKKGLKLLTLSSPSLNGVCWHWQPTHCTILSIDCCLSVLNWTDSIVDCYCLPECFWKNMIFNINEIFLWLH